MARAVPVNLFATGFVLLISNFFRDPSSDRLALCLGIAAVALIVGGVVFLYAKRTVSVAIEATEAELGGIDPLDVNFEERSARVIEGFDRKLQSQWSPVENGQFAVGALVSLGVLLEVFGLAGIFTAIIVAAIWLNR